MAEEAVEGGTPAQAVFYNMTGMDVDITLNSSDKETIAAIPTATPYTPNHNANTYTRVNVSNPRPQEFGNSNHLKCESGGGVDMSVSVNIELSGAYKPVTHPLLVFIFFTAVIVTFPDIDSVPFVGHDGDTINAGGSATTL